MRGGVKMEGREDRRGIKGLGEGGGGKGEGGIG